MYQLNYQSYAQAAAVPQRALQLMAAGCPQEMAQVFCHILAAQPATIAPLELSQQLGLSVLQVDRALECPRAGKENRQDHLQGARPFQRYQHRNHERQNQAYAQKRDTADVTG